MLSLLGSLIQIFRTDLLRNIGFEDCQQLEYQIRLSSTPTVSMFLISLLKILGILLCLCSYPPISKGIDQLATSNFQPFQYLQQTNPFSISNLLQYSNLYCPSYQFQISMILITQLTIYKQKMGDQVSCCDARAQLQNVNSTNLLSRTANDLNQNQKVLKFSLPMMSNGVKQIIQKAQKTKYFKQKPTPNDRIKQTLIYGADKQRALYEGGISQGLADGYGTVSFQNGSFFQGHFLKGQPTNGIFVFNESCYYVGDIEKFQASGSGIYENIQNGYYYEGEWKKNLQHGQGIEKYSNRDQYTGGFLCGSKFGEGEYKFSDNKVYKGSFYNGHSDGNGKLTLPNGDYYDGQWKLGQMHGKGTYKWKNGEKYEGQYVNGVRENRGKYYFSSGAYYEGEWLNGLQNGEGSIVEGYDEVKGTWQAGEKID